ncbi:MAG: hypothetical protein U5P41_07170 [Gammaproteobacteria bacterium]|nr:hypothetical protein [Gammaproteobacteria bacterium]
MVLGEPLNAAAQAVTLSGGNIQFDGAAVDGHQTFASAGANQVIPADVQHIGTTSNTSTKSSYTFTGVNAGTPATDRLVVVVVHVEKTGGSAFSL